MRGNISRGLRVAFRMLAVTSDDGVVADSRAGAVGLFRNHTGWYSWLRNYSFKSHEQ